jgi:hypothetical protein
MMVVAEVATGTRGQGGAGEGANAQLWVHGAHREA